MHHEHHHRQPRAHGAAMPPNERHAFLHQSPESAEARNATAPQDLRIGNLVIPGVRLQPNVVPPTNVMSGYYGAPPPPSLEARGSIGGAAGLPIDGVDGPVGGGGGACPPPTTPLKRFVTPEDDDISAAARAALGGGKPHAPAATHTSAPGLKRSHLDFCAGTTAVLPNGDCIIGRGSLMSIPEDNDFSLATGGLGKSCAPILPTGGKFDPADVKDAGSANSFLPPHIRQLLRQHQQPQALTQPLPPTPCLQKKPEIHKPASPSLVSDYLTGKLDTHENIVQAGQSGPNKRKRPDDDPEDRPLVRGEDVHDNDVLCGRGGGTNHNVGNKRYRDLVRYYQPLYVVVPKREKLRVSKGIVSAVRHATPAGRFLERVEDAKPRSGGTGRGETEERYAGSALYRDIGDRRAWDKTSQTLREGAPEIRKNAEIEKAVAAARIGCGSWVTHLQAAVRRQEQKEAEKGRRSTLPGRGGTGTEAAALHTAALLSSAGGKGRQEEGGDAVAARGAAAAKATAMAATLVQREEEARLRRQQQQRLADAGSVSTLALPSSAHLATSSLMDSQNQVLAAAVAQAAAAAGGAKAGANNLSSAYINSLVGGPQAQLGNYHSATPFGVAPRTTTAAPLTDKTVLERYIAGSVIANPPQLIPSDTLSSSARTLTLPSAATLSLSGRSVAGDIPESSCPVADPQSEVKFNGTDSPLDKAKKAGAAMVPNVSRIGGDCPDSTGRAGGGKSRSAVKERRHPAEAKEKTKVAPRRSSVPLPQPTLSRRGNGRRSSLPHVAADHSPPATDNKERLSDGPKPGSGNGGGSSPSDARELRENGSGPDVVPKSTRRRSSSKRIYEEQIKAAQAYIKHLTSLQQEQDKIDDEEQGSDASGSLEGDSGSGGDGLGDRETRRQLSTADVAQKTKSHLQNSSLEMIANSAMAAYREHKASSERNLSGVGRDTETADGGTRPPSKKGVVSSVPKTIPNSNAGKEISGDEEAIALKRVIKVVDEKDGSVKPTSQEQFSSLMQLSQVAFALDEGCDTTSRGGRKTADSPKFKCEDRAVGKRTPPLPLKKRLRSVEPIVPKETTSLHEGPCVDAASAGGVGMTNQEPVVGHFTEKKTGQDAILKALCASSGKGVLNEAVGAKLTSFPGNTSNEAGPRPASHPATSHLPLSLGDQVDLLRRLQMCTSAGTDLLPQELFSSFQSMGAVRDMLYQDLSSTAGVQSQSEDQFACLLQRVLRQQRESTLDALAAHLGGNFSKRPLP